LAFNIVYKKSVQRDLSKLSRDEAGRILARLEKDLAEKADSYPALKGRFAGLRKYRIGDYRVVFAFVDSEVQVLRIGHRRDIYRKDV
jgi:mRNA interferase RelE/StbE